jgi:CRISPR-associated protein Cmr5
MNTTIAQQRSAFALKKVQSANADKFDKLVAGLPAMILQNGFGQSMAFLLAKGKDHHHQAFDIVREWLVNRKLLSANRGDQFMSELSSLPQEKYLRAQEEALAVLEWVKRYANAGLFK